MATRGTTRRLRCALLGALALLAIGSAAPASSAGILPGSGCNYPPAIHPFMRWGDGASYSLMQGGSFENGANGWLLAGGARVVSGNESYNVTAASDSHSLSIPTGGAATTPLFCVNLTRPTIRFFASNTGASTSRLRVKAVFRNALGILGILDGGMVAAGSTWQPSPIMLATLSAPLGSNSVQFTFSPTDGTGAWRIDDIYVDPWVDRG